VSSIQEVTPDVISSERCFNTGSDCHGHRVTNKGK
jgi:hypothetical protein